MDDVPNTPERLDGAASTIDQLTEALLGQLDVLRSVLQESSSHDLATALAELHDRVTELLDLDLRSMSASSEASLRGIAAATERIEQARRRIVDDLASTTSAEGALRQWTGSEPGDERIRPGRDGDAT